MELTLFVMLVILGFTFGIIFLIVRINKLANKVDWLASELRPLQTTLYEVSLVSEMTTLRDQLHEILAEMNVEPRTPSSSTEDRYQKQCLELARFLEEARRKRQEQLDLLGRQQ